ncbi:MAG: Lrp/AsnC ligand binding domain-containing protein [archaeon]
MVVVVYMLIITRHGKTRLVLNALRKYDEIKELHEIYGQYDLICKVETETHAELRTFIQNRINIAENIKSAETLVASDVIDEHEEPVANDEKELDAPVFGSGL